MIVLAYDGMTALDAIGPYEVLSRARNAQVTFVAEKAGPITTDTGFLQLVAEKSIEQVDDADLVLVPGGPMTGALGDHPPIRDWLRKVAPKAQYFATVCTGALIAAQAGVLTGVRTTTHWAAHDQLSILGAVPVQERVVVDGKHFSAAGVSAGIDLGLRLLSEIEDENYAMAIQLLVEYDPAPPFTAGSPSTAPAAVLDKVRRRLAHSRAPVASNSSDGA